MNTLGPLDLVVIADPKTLGEMPADSVARTVADRSTAPPEFEL